MRPEIWSIGHRNMQAAALHPTTGELWEIEHGTRGGDEINIARKGKDYGWPTIAYGIEYRGGPITGGIQQQAGMEQPLYYWDPDHRAERHGVLHRQSVSRVEGQPVRRRPCARAISCGSTLDGDKVVGEERLLKDLKKRIRDVRVGPEGALYLLTDATNGELLKLVPKK